MVWDMRIGMAEAVRGVAAACGFAALVGGCSAHQSHLSATELVDAAVLIRATVEDRVAPPGGSVVVEVRVTNHTSRRVEIGSESNKPWLQAMRIDVADRDLVEGWKGHAVAIAPFVVEAGKQVSLSRDLDLRGEPPGRYLVALNVDRCALERYAVVVNIPAIVTLDSESP